MSLTRSHLQTLAFLRKTAADQNLDPGAQAMMAASKINPMSGNPSITPIDTSTPEQTGEDTSKLEEAHRKELEKKDEELRKARAENDRANLLLEKQKAEADLVAQHTQHLEALRKQQDQLKSEEAQQKANLAAAEAEHRSRLAEQKADMMVSTSEQKAKMLMDAADQNAKAYVQMTQDAQEANQNQFASQFENLSKQQADILNKQNELVKQKEEISNSRFGISDFTRKSVSDAVAATKNLTKLRSRLQAMPNVYMSDAHAPVEKMAYYNEDGEWVDTTYKDIAEQQKQNYLAQDGATLKERLMAEAQMKDQMAQANGGKETMLQKLTAENLADAQASAAERRQELNNLGGTSAAGRELAEAKDFTDPRRGLSGWMEDNPWAFAIAGPALYAYDKYVNDHSSEYDRMANASALAKKQAERDKENWGMKALRGTASFLGDMTLGGITNAAGDWVQGNDIARNHGVSRNFWEASSDNAEDLAAYNQAVKDRGLASGWGRDLGALAGETALTASMVIPGAGAIGGAARVGAAGLKGMKAVRTGAKFMDAYKATRATQAATQAARAAANPAWMNNAMKWGNRAMGVYGYGSMGAGLADGVLGTNMSSYMVPGRGYTAQNSYISRGGYQVDPYTGSQSGFQTNSPAAQTAARQVMANTGSTPNLSRMQASSAGSGSAASKTSGLGASGATKAAAVADDHTSTEQVPNKPEEFAPIAGKATAISPNTAHKFNTGYVDWTPQGASRMYGLKHNTWTNNALKYGPILSQLTGGMIAPYAGAYDPVRPDWYKRLTSESGLRASATALSPEAWQNTGIWDRRGPAGMNSTSGQAMNAMWRASHPMQTRDVNMPRQLHQDTSLTDLISSLTQSF